MFEEPSSVLERLRAAVRTENRAAGQRLAVMISTTRSHTPMAV
jgi:hypothetical protein